MWKEQGSPNALASVRPGGLTHGQREGLLRKLHEGTATAHPPGGLYEGSLSTVLT